MSSILQNHSPFKSLRIHHNYSQREISELAQVGAQVVLLNEFGCYNHPNPKILSFFKAFGESPEILEFEYEQFRISQRDLALNGVANPQNPFLAISRALSGSRLSNLGDPPNPGFFDINSMQAWNKWKRQFSLSTVGFCKTVCLQPSIISSFENSLYARNWRSIKEWLWPVA